MHHVSPKVPADLAAAGWADADERISRLAARARKQGASRVRTLLLDGVPHERIASAARSRRADLVVIGTHGRTGLAKLFLGSVASRVVSSATCPVLTVRGR